MKTVFCPIITNKDIGGGIKSTIALLNALVDEQHPVVALVPKDCEFLEKLNPKIRIAFFSEPPTISLLNPIKYLKLCKFTKKIVAKYEAESETIFLCSDRPALMLALLMPRTTKLFYISRGWFYTNLSARFLRMVLFPRVQQFVGISDKQYLLMKKYAPKNAKVNLIQNGIDLPNHQFTPFASETLHLTTIGGICDRKNQMQCLELVLLLKENFPVHLHIFGTTFTPIDVAYKETLLAFIAKNNLEKNVTFEGHETNFDVIYNQSDIVLSVAKEEGFGRTIIEAMSYGIPVIASSKAGGPSTIITHQINGLLYDSSLDDLMQKVIELVENKQLRKTIIENALLHVKKNYTIKRVGMDYSKLINSL